MLLTVVDPEVPVLASPDPLVLPEVLTPLAEPVALDPLEDPEAPEPVPEEDPVVTEEPLVEPDAPDPADEPEVPEAPELLPDEDAVAEPLEVPEPPDEVEPVPEPEPEPLWEPAPETPDAAPLVPEEAEDPAAAAELPPLPDAEDPSPDGLEPQAVLKSAGAVRKATQARTRGVLFTEPPSPRSGHAWAESVSFVDEFRRERGCRFRWRPNIPRPTERSATERCEMVEEALLDTASIVRRHVGHGEIDASVSPADFHVDVNRRETP